MDKQASAHDDDGSLFVSWQQRKDVSDLDQTILLEMKDIDKVFPGVKALDKAQLTVKSGTVHALMGENGAGKSTLMKCLYGIYYRDGGSVKLEGQEVNFSNSKEALDHGVAMIHQELQPIPQMTIAENIFLGDYPKKGLFVDHELMERNAQKYLDVIGLQVSPKTKLADLTISQQQSVEIAKAISHKAKVLIMDEPTSSLTSSEVAHLFKVIDALRATGMGIIYISHKMDEILRISDEITIMRDGQYVGTHDAKQVTINQIIKDMVGRELVNQFPEKEFGPGQDNILEVRDYSSPNPLSFQNCSFDLKEGEILGVAGLVGAQRSELMEAIFGLREKNAGAKLTLKGQSITIKDPKDAIKHGFAFVTEDRRNSGIFGVLSVSDNTITASLPAYKGKFGLLSEDKIDTVVQKGIQSMKIKTPNAQAAIQNLSGGNQQKVILSRWLATNPEVFILDEPTRGIDVGAKYEIYEIINQLAREGKSVILISSEMSEILGLSDRIMVMCEGKIAGFLDKAEATQEKVMDLATKFMQSNEVE